jgi:hypothetical protein
MVSSVDVDHPSIQAVVAAAPFDLHASLPNTVRFLAAAETLLTHPIQRLRLRYMVAVQARVEGKSPYWSKKYEVAMKIPKFACSAVCLASCAISVLAPVVAQQNQPQAAVHKELEQSPLEAFASRSTATVVWSKAIGRLETRDAQATLTVVALEDQTTAAKGCADSESISRTLV